MAAEQVSAVPGVEKQSLPYNMEEEQDLLKPVFRCYPFSIFFPLNVYDRENVYDRQNPVDSLSLFDRGNEAFRYASGGDDGGVDQKVGRGGIVLRRGVGARRRYARVLFCSYDVC
jgi:hypothetical protein